MLDTLFDEPVLVPDTDLRPHLQTAHAAIGDTDDLLNCFSQPVVPPQLSLPAIGENLANAFDRRKVITSLDPSLKNCVRFVDSELPLTN